MSNVNKDTEATPENLEFVSNTKTTIESSEVDLSSELAKESSDIIEEEVERNHVGVVEENLDTLEVEQTKEEDISPSQKEPTEEKLESEKKNDEVIEKKYFSSLIRQKEENLIYYEITNIYKNEKKKIYHNKFKLKKSPPLLSIKDEDGNLVEFALTENLTDDLLESLKEVKRAYYGFDGPLDKNAPKNKKDKLIYYLKKNAIKVFVLVLIVSYLVFLNFI